MAPLQAETGIIWLERAESTNHELRSRIDGLDNLSVIAAHEQTAGRGQGDHSWFSSPGANLTFSMLMRSSRSLRKISDKIGDVTKPIGR